MSVVAKAVLEVDQLQVLTGSGYSNAEEVTRCECENIEVAAPIKRGAMNSEHFRPVQFLYDEDSDTSHRLVDQSSLNRMEARIHANPSLMKIRRCTVEHPFGTVKRMSGGGRFLRRGLRAVKAAAALSILAFNMLHAANTFGTRAITPN